MRLKDVLNQGEQRLKGAGFSTPVLDAEVLMAHILGQRKTFLYSHPDYELTEEEKWRYEELIARRLLHEPVAYLVEEKEFWSRSFKVDRRVLIPRPETEVLVEVSLELADAFPNDRLKVVDVGTGSGAIGITFAAEVGRSYVLATDISKEALDVAETNACRLGVRERMDFVLCSGLDAVSGTFHFILSNPPYVPTEEIRHLPAGIKNFEPLIALDGGCEGLELHEKLVREASSRLSRGGWLIMEVGDDGAKRVEKMALESGKYEEVKVIKDYLGQDRVVAARKA